MYASRGFTVEQERIESAAVRSLEGASLYGRELGRDGASLWRAPHCKQLSPQPSGSYIIFLGDRL